MIQTIHISSKRSSIRYHVPLSSRQWVPTITQDCYCSINRYVGNSNNKKQQTDNQMEKLMHICTTKFNYFHMSERTTSLDVLVTRTRLASTVEKKTPSTLTSERRQKQSNKAHTQTWDAVPPFLVIFLYVSSSPLQVQIVCLQLWQPQSLWIPRRA